MNQAERRWQIHQRRREPSDQDEETFRHRWYLESEKQICNCQEPEPTMRAPNKMYFSGLLLTYKPLAKTTCWKVCNQFIKQGAFYREIFDRMMAKYTDRMPNGKKHIILKMAMRATIKLFLSHYWEMLRRSEGLPAGEYYLEALRKKVEASGVVFQDHEYTPPPYAEVFSDANTETIRPGHQG